jgi:hypothetical protein
LPLRGAPLDVAVGPSGSGQRPDPVEADVAFPAALHQHRSPPRQARSAGSATAWQSVGSPPSPQGTPEALPYPILRRLSSISDSRAAPRCGRRKSRGQGVGRGGYCGVAPGPLPGGGLGRAPAGAARARDQGRVECEGWRCVACMRLVSVIRTRAKTLHPCRGKRGTIEFISMKESTAQGEDAPGTTCASGVRRCWGRSLSYSSHKTLESNKSASGCA